MTQTIKTPRGDYIYETVHLFHGRKKIGKGVARENLLVVREILDKADIRWGLIFGTLLGAIRENDFIEHDEDTDIFVLEEDREKLISQLFDLKKQGFAVARYETSLMSIIRNNEYIDFYFFAKTLSGRRAGAYYVPRIHFSAREFIPLFQVQFPTVYKPVEFLTYTYGKDWKISKIGCHAEGKPVLWKTILRKMFPQVYALYRKLRNYD